MHLGFIVNDSHPLLKTIDESQLNNVKGSKPILIVGLEKATELFPETSLLNKTIDPETEIYYSFSKEESLEQYNENISNCLKRLLVRITSKFQIIKVVQLSQLTFEPNARVFLYETPSTITLTTNGKIFYLNKEIINFFLNNQAWSINDFLPDNVEVISWTGFHYFGAFLKAADCYKSHDQFFQLLSSYCDIKLYMGALCLNWLAQLSFQDDCVALWQRAYFVENYLSEQPIRIDVKLLKASLPGNSIYEAIYEKLQGSCVYHSYNGTDKATGRIFPSGSGFSIQTLTPQLRKIVIAEEECLLTEFDYNYFEYSLMFQLLGLKIPGDPHAYLSKLIFGNEDKRQFAKQINYGLLYGQAIDTTIDRLLKADEEKIITLKPEEIKKLLKQIIEPIEQLKKELTKNFQNNGFIINVFGRKVYPRKSSDCLSYFNQSTAADFMISKIVRLVELLKQYDPINHIVLQNHDSILFNLKIQDVENTPIAIDIKTILEDEELGLKCEVDLEYGSNYHLK